MAYTYHDLKLKTVQELRDIAKDVQHDAVQGYSQMNKEHLLPALCKALGIEAHEHHEVSGSTSRQSSRRCASSGRSVTRRSRRTTATP